MPDISNKNTPRNVHSFCNNKLKVFDYIRMQKVEAEVHFVREFILKKLIERKREKIGINARLLVENPFAVKNPIFLMFTLVIILICILKKNMLYAFW